MDYDRKQIQSVIDTFYKIISGKAGEPRDWEEFRRLFFKNASLTPNIFSDDNKSAAVSYDLESYITRLNQFLTKNDFFEKGIINRIDLYCNIAQVDSSYAAKSDPALNELVKEGKNFIQLLHDGESWKIVSMLWEDE